MHNKIIKEDSPQKLEWQLTVYYNNQWFIHKWKSNDLKFNKDFNKMFDRFFNEFEGSIQYVKKGQENI